MRRPSWSVIAIFSVIAVMIAAINARPAFPDPDSFYHAKMALIIRDQGFIHEFPWMQETALREEYVDPHLLYHVILIPFVTIFDPLVGMKVSAAVFGLLAFYALYRFLRSMEAPYPEWIVLASAFSFDFLHRMSLPRAPSLSVAMLILAIWAMTRGRWKTLFAVTTAFVWLYYGWAVIVAAYGCVAAGALIARFRRAEEPGFPIFKLGFALVAGIAVGLVVNPYFPENVLFSYESILNFGVKGTTSISVGAEWSAPNWPLMLFWNFPVIQTMLVSVAMLWLARKKGEIDTAPRKVRTALAMSLLMAFFLFFALRSIRYTEYLIPFVAIAAGSLLALVGPFLARETKRLRHDLAGALVRIRKHPRIAACALLAIAMLFPLITIRGINYSAKKDGVFTKARYEGSAEWVRANVPPGATVFNNLWDSSMIYFYLDDSHYYLIGLDPRFMHDKSAERYQDWMSLIMGGNPDVERVVSEFNASAVWIDRRVDGAFVANLDASPSFEKAYEDEWAIVFVPKKSL